MKIKKRNEIERVIHLMKGEEGHAGKGAAGRDHGEGMMRNIISGALLGASSVMDVETVMIPYRKTLDVSKMSDSLMHKQLGLTPIDAVRNRCYRIHRTLRQEGMFRFPLSDGRTIRLGHLDGVQIMTHAYETLVVSGKVNAGIDYEPCTKGGNECVAAIPLLRRAKEQGIELDLVTGDGITYSIPYWRAVREEGMAFFTSVRGNDGRGLVLVKETDALIKIDERSPIGSRQMKTAGIVHGDAKYTIQVVSHHHEGLGCPVKIGKLLKTYLKGKRKGVEEVHYTITDMVSLSPQDMIMVAIAHWEVESHFHELKNDFWSAHSYKEKDEDALKLLLLVSTAMNLVKYGKMTIFTDDTMSVANKKRLTKKIVRLLLSRILVDLPVDSLVAC